MKDFLPSACPAIEHVYMHKMGIQKPVMVWLFTFRHHVWVCLGCFEWNEENKQKYERRCYGFGNRRTGVWTPQAIQCSCSRQKSLAAARDSKGISKLPRIQLILPYKSSYFNGSSEIPLLSLAAAQTRALTRDNKGIYSWFYLLTVVVLMVVQRSPYYP